MLLSDIASVNGLDNGSHLELNGCLFGFDPLNLIFHFRSVLSIFESSGNTTLCSF